MAVTQRHSEGGWSLIELVITIGMIGVLAGIALWRLDVARYQVNAGIRSAGLALVAAQREAMVKHYNVVVTFDEAVEGFHILYDKNNNFIKDAGEITRSVKLDDRVVFGLGGAMPRAFGSGAVDFDRTIGGLQTLIFYRNGSASYGGGFYLTSRRAMADSRYSDDTRALEIERATGRIQWWQYDAGTWTQGF
jgi:Tfp pilus assembly major pilin PilA